MTAIWTWFYAFTWDSWAVSMTGPGTTLLYWVQSSHITGCLERSVWADYRLYFWYLESWDTLVQCWCIIHIQRHQNPLKKLQTFIHDEAPPTAHDIVFGPHSHVSGDQCLHQCWTFLPCIFCIRINWTRLEQFEAWGFRDYPSTKDLAQSNHT